MSESKAILVDCITLHHHYRGWLSTNARLSDELSSAQADTIVLRDVQITPAGRNAPSLECSQITLQKTSILLAIPQGDNPASPEQRLSKFQKKQRYGVVLALPGHLISGVMQLPKSSVSWSLLRENGAVQRFAGLTDVTVHNAVFRLTPATCPVAIVQRDAVEAIELTSAPLVEEQRDEVLAE